MVECFYLSMVAVQERRLVAFFQFGNAKVTLGRKRVLGKNIGLLS